MLKEKGLDDLAQDIRHLAFTPKTKRVFKSSKFPLSLSSLEQTKHISLRDFEVLFRNHYGELCAFANKYLEDVEAAEEIVQDLFVKFWENREKNELPNALRSYLFTSVKNACLNQLKHLKIKETYKAHNERELNSAHVSADEELEATELDQKIRQAIEALPEGRRRIFILSRYEGLKYQEIADQLKLSVKTVENQMGEALKFLRIQLKDFLVTLIVLIKLIDDLW
ncbi:MAG: RNA polymerase sigma-70 factor [Bacteroidetes bacterium]|nr:RNA polymerase sigma-70 factor [Bacteroidota bacterium]